MEKVVFDSNAYRYLVANKTYEELDKYLKKIKSKEATRGIESLISPIVTKELLAHVASKKDPAYEKCLKAIKALYLHSSEEDGNKYRMIASPELLISKVFFKESLPQKEETNKALVQIAYHLAQDPNDYTFKKFQKNLNLNKDHVLSSENFYSTSLMQLMRSLDPDSEGWKIFPKDEVKRKKALEQIRSDNTSIDLAAGQIVAIAEVLKSVGKNIDLDGKKLFDMSLKFMEVFPEFIALYKVVLENLVNSEFNLLENSRSNFLWDTQLMMNIGDHTIQGDKLYFVTDDKAILRTAIQENAKYSILTFDEYLAYIN